MPFETFAAPPRRIAVIGGGISGMAAAHFLAADNAVVLFEEDTPYELIAALEPDVLVKGADYQEHQIVGADLVKAKGGIIVRVELRAGHSTTGLVDRSRTPSA